MALYDKYKKSEFVTREEFDRAIDSLTVDKMNIMERIRKICPHKEVFRTNSFRYYTCSVCGESIFKSDVPEGTKKMQLIDEDDDKYKLLTMDEYFKLKELASTELKKNKKSD